jgi:transglutaminase-like putative cysteine protease
MSVATATIGARPLTLRRSVSPLLVTALVIATGWSVLAGGWTDGTTGVLIVGLAGVVGGLALARLRTPRPLALIVAPVLLFVSLLPTNAASRPVGAGTGFGHLVGQYAAAAVTGLLGNAQWEFSVALGALLWVCGAWAAWFAVREKRGAIATGPCWAVIAVNVINAPSTSGVTLPATLAAGAALLLIAAVHLDRLSVSWRQRRVSVLPGTGGRFATAALFGGALIVLLALVIPPLSSTDISGHLFGGGGSGSGVHNGQSGTASGQGGATVRFNAATIPGGTLHLSTSAVYTYHSSLATGVYLRMATDGVFDAGDWLPAPSTNSNGDSSELNAGAGTIPRDRVLSDGGVGGQQQTVSLTARMLEDTSDTSTLPFAGEPDTSSVPVHIDGLTGAASSGQLLTVDSVQSIRPVVGTTFTTTATESAASAPQLRQAGTTYPSFIKRNFLDLRNDGTGGATVIRELAEKWTTNAHNPYDKATTIEAMLRNPQNFHYTLDPPASADNVWPVTYFLATSHSGYCQYFAAAMGAMLRTLGIPARLINGYGPGTAPSAEAASRGSLAASTWTVASSDAHTWVEAYFPRYGWIPFEPTPPSVAGIYQPFTRGGVVGARPVPTSAASSTGAHPKVVPHAESPGAGSASAQSTNGNRVIMGLAGLGVALFLMLALFGAWFLRPRSIRGVWTRVGIIGRLLGVPRDRALTFDEYVDHLTAALPVGDATAWPRRLGDGLRDIAVLSDRTFYAPPTAPADDANLKRAWRRVALLAPRLGRRPPRPQPST